MVLVGTLPLLLDEAVGATNNGRCHRVVVPIEGDRPRRAVGPTKGSEDNNLVYWHWQAKRHKGLALHVYH